MAGAAASDETDACYAAAPYTDGAHADAVSGTGHGADYACTGDDESRDPVGAVDDGDRPHMYVLALYRAGDAHGVSAAEARLGRGRDVRDPAPAPRGASSPA